MHHIEVNIKKSIWNLIVFKQIGCKYRRCVLFYQAFRAYIVDRNLKLKR